jgi:hypothetical protein
VTARGLLREPADRRFKAPSSRDLLGWRGYHALRLTEA